MTHFKHFWSVIYKLLLGEYVWTVTDSEDKSGILILYMKKEALSVREIIGSEAIQFVVKVAQNKDTMERYLKAIKLFAPNNAGLFYRQKALGLYIDELAWCKVLLDGGLFKLYLLPSKRKRGTGVTRIDIEDARRLMNEPNCSEKEFPQEVFIQYDKLAPIEKQLFKM